MTARLVQTYGRASPVPSGPWHEPPSTPRMTHAMLALCPSPLHSGRQHCPQRRLLGRRQTQLFQNSQDKPDLHQPDNIMASSAVWAALTAVLQRTALGERPGALLAGD